MLHVQESFAHTSNLLMTPPITVIVQPQPSSSSRSNKVVEQLGGKLESIYMDIAATRQQVKKIDIQQQQLMISKNGRHL